MIPTDFQVPDLNDTRVNLERSNVNRVLLATDAISCWLLVDDAELQQDRIHRILACQTLEDFKELVSSERLAGALKVDDSTIAVLGIRWAS